MSNEMLLAIIGITGTLLGTFIGSLFSFLSLKRQFAHSVRTIRVNRTFDSYEALLDLVIAAQVSQTHIKDGKTHRLSTMLFDEDKFRIWYPAFLQAWHQKKYLLDFDSLSSCEALAVFIVDFLNKYPGFRAESTDKPKLETLSEMLQTHDRFLQLLSKCYESLRQYLLNGIEED